MAKRFLHLPKPLYSFSEKVSLSPFKESYQPGDTIRIRFDNAGKRLYDKFSGRNITNDTTYMNVEIGIARQFPKENNADLPGVAMVKNGHDVRFEPYLPGASNLAFHTECNSDSYSFTIAFVPTQKGIFTIYLGGNVAPCAGKRDTIPTELRFSFGLDDCNKMCGLP